MASGYSFRIMLRPEPEGGYTVIVPSLPGCITYGKTVDEAVSMAECNTRLSGKHEKTR